MIKKNDFDQVVIKFQVRRIETLLVGRFQINSAKHHNRATVVLDRITR